MRIRILFLLCAALLLSVPGCPALREVSPEEHRVHCDDLALQAVEAESLDEARILATRAAECYENLQAQRR
jgi:hypothetical protein